MAIDKVTGKAWADLSEINSVAKADIAKVVGQDASSGVSATVVTDNLWISFDPNHISGTTITDQSGNSRHGTLTNGATVVSNYNGATKAFYTDGTNDYAQRATTSNPSTGFPYTIESWHYRQNIANMSNGNAPTVGKPHNSRFRFVDHGVFATDYTDSYGNRGAYHRYYTNSAFGGTNTYSDLYYADLSNTTSNGGAVLKSAVDTIIGTTGDEWIHLCTVFSYNNNNRISIKGYINGTKVKDIDGDDVDVTGSTVGTNAAWPWEDGGTCSYGFGYRERYTTADSYQKGHWGDYRLYTDALTDAEVLNNFNATKSKYGY